MDWSKFNNHGESNNRAFEVMCNLLFESWCKRDYSQQLSTFSFINGAGGDGGVEAVAYLIDNQIIAVQSKWFPNKVDNTQIKQIETSFKTALNVHPNITKYVVCIPRDLGDKKIIKGGASTNNTERNKWNRLVLKLTSTNPNTEIILWDETSIQRQLTRPENEGIYKFWFENTVVFESQIKLAYEKVKYGWGNLKYIPEIHIAGYIHKKLECFIDSTELFKGRIRTIEEFIGKLERLQNSYKDLLELGLPVETYNLAEKIKNDIKKITDLINVFNINLDMMKTGGRAKEINDNLILDCSVRDLTDSPFYFGKYFHFIEVKKILEDIENNFYQVSNLFKYPDSNKMIFLGGQGTGKTAGIIAEASNLLENSYHLPIIIHAREYKEGDTWSAIISNTLSLGNNWNEIELFGALQIAAFMKGFNTKDVNIEPKCVIMVDGIDEAPSWQFWKQKIEETTAFKDKFPRTKFVFLSRPYVFENFSKLSYRDCFNFLPITGDGEIEKVCDSYLEKYNIDIGENYWIKSYLKTPIAIKLFADIYRDKKIENLGKNTLVLTKLFKEKISSMEELYSISHNEVRGIPVIQTILTELALLFAKKNSIQYEEIYQRISEQFRSSLNDILHFLVDEGFLYTYNRKDDEFSTPEIFYSWGIQPAFDYLIAQKKYQSIQTDKKIKIENSNGIYQMLSLIAIENGKCITEYPKVEVSKEISFYLVCYALANCSPTIAKKYVEFLLAEMKKSVEKFRYIFCNVIQSTYRINQHPLGVLLLDTFLRQFDKPAERDIWWSIPINLYNGKNIDQNIDFEKNLENIKIYESDSYYSSPLLIVWSFASVRNTIRKNNRVKLLSWGIRKPLEFLKLFEKCNTINDFQVIEDLFAVAYGLALEQNISDKYLTEISNWCLENLFSRRGLKKYENITIRYYASSIVKIAISRNLLDESQRYLVTPPYDYKISKLQLYRPALKSDRMGGHKAIDYDLARYVLCDNFDRFFWRCTEGEEFHSKARKFITRYISDFNLSQMKVDGLIIGLAYRFLMNQGWREEKFWVCKSNNQIGVDMLISREYPAATHGEMSPVMTVAEKYVWLARHQLEAVFSNEIPSREDFNTFQYVNDYSRYTNFVNVYQDYVNDMHRLIDHDWFNANILANPSFERMDIGKINNWIMDTSVPPFDKWLSNYNKELLLYSATLIQNNISGVEEIMWISAGAIQKKDFGKFLRRVDGEFKDKAELMNANNFYSYQDCFCYCTPQEACLVHSAREINSTLKINPGNIEIIKLVEECLCEDKFKEERSFLIPSNVTRRLANIVYGDGFSYSDDKGNVIARFSENMENWNHNQKILMINQDSIKNGLDKSNLKLFWLFRIYRNPSSKARERFEKLIHSNDRSFIVWKSNKGFEFKEIFENKYVK